MAQSSPMNGGDGIYSYNKNSSLQRNGLNAAIELMKEALMENIDVKNLVGDSNTITIADLGCSVGPNTFFAMQTIIDILQHKYHHDSKTLEFQVLFNDSVFNDFNTLFASLPDQRNYFAAGVPGSFYGRLFPSSSVHVVFTSSSLHWLSRAPEELSIKHSAAWNGGRIHYTGAPEKVVKAYVDQYEEDMGVFLGARGEEIVGGGVIVILMPGVPHGLLTHDIGIALTFLESLLIDLVKEGLIDQEKFDSFNIPHLYPSVEQMKRVVQKNGDFEIVKMELITNATPNLDAPINIEGAIMHLRAFSEGTIAHHFGSSEIVDQIFDRALLQKTKFSHMLYPSGIKIPAQLFAVLQRK
ncbi:hypothetical protein ACS0TY_023602 [Phlomoides rotata]